MVAKYNVNVTNLDIQIHGQVAMLEEGEEGKWNGSSVHENCEVEREQSVVEGEREVSYYWPQSF